MIDRQVGEGKDGGGTNPRIKRHLELEIKTLLQNAPRDADSFGTAFKSKEKTKGAGKQSIIVFPLGQYLE